MAALLALLVAQVALRRRRTRREGRRGLDPDDPADWWDEDELVGSDGLGPVDPTADVSASLSRGRQPRIDLNRERPRP